MRSNIHPAILNSLAGLTSNIAGAWFTIAFISPNFKNTNSLLSAIEFTKNISACLLFIIVNIVIEKIKERGL